MRIRCAPISTALERSAWNELSTHSSIGHMHQCLWWAEPLTKYGIASQVIGCWRGNQLVGGALFRQIPLPMLRATVGVCLHGPIFHQLEPEWAESFVHGVREFARQSNSVAITFEGCPDIRLRDDLFATMTAAGLRMESAPGRTHAILSLTGMTPDSVWKNLSHGTRYRIRKAEKNSITVRRLEGDAELEAAYGAWIATARRKGFDEVRPWSALKPVIEACNRDDVGMVLGSFRENELLAAIFVTLIGQNAEYVHGGYYDNCQQYSPNHVLQHEAIRICLERGKRGYDFGALECPEAPGEHGADSFKLAFATEPQEELPMLTWLCRPRLYRGLRWLRQRVGYGLEQRLRQWLLRD